MDACTLFTFLSNSRKGTFCIRIVHRYNIVFAMLAISMSLMPCRNLQISPSARAEHSEYRTVLRVCISRMSSFVPSDGLLLSHVESVFVALSFPSREFCCQTHGSQTKS